MPYEAIDEATYSSLVAGVWAAQSGAGRGVVSRSVRGEGSDSVPDKFCDNDSCKTL